MQSITVTQPDDFHLHLRDAEYLQRTVTDSAAHFARAIVMPNLPDPVDTVDKALAYKQRIQAHIPKSCHFAPLMTLYLRDNTTEETLLAAAKHPDIYACKLYPAGATTHSAAGVQSLEKLYPLLEVMQSVDLPLLIHGEVTDASVDIFDREAVFIDTQLSPIVREFPNLRIVLEHISSAVGVEYINDAPVNVAATITAHHLYLTRNDLLASGIKPDYYCLPIVKTQTDKEALIQAATNGSAKFFLGTDSAPHARDQKCCPSGAAGIYTTPIAMSLYAEVFENAGALERLDAFVSGHGATFYGLEKNKQTLTLVKETFEVPQQLDYSTEKVSPLFAGRKLTWRVCADSDKK